MTRQRAIFSKPPAPPPSPDDEPAAPPSKTRRKHEMHVLQDMGERLAELKPEQLKQFQLPDELATAIGDYRRFTKWEAKRRQMQYIGRLMRDLDPAPIAARLDQWNQTSREAVAGFHAAEAWRDRLLAEENASAAMDALVAQYPRADRKRIAQLADNARSERASGKPPASSRLLFRELSRLVAAGEPSADADADE